MPIYEYQCAQCGKLTDVRHGFKEVNQEPCQACGGELKRRFTPTGIVFKGSGFYVTDSRKRAEPAAKDTATPAGEQGAAAAAKSEATPTADAGSKTEPAQKTEPSAAPPKREPGSGAPKKDAAA